MHESPDLESLMSEPPGGHNHGHRATDHLFIEDEGGELQQRWTTLETQSMDRREREGYGVVYPGHGGTRGNPNGAIVHPDVHVDGDHLRTLVEEAFGFRLAQVTAVYSSKRLDGEARALRAKMDARILALYEAGANMGALARLLGMSRTTLDRARVRAQGGQS